MCRPQSAVNPAQGSMYAYEVGVTGSSLDTILHACYNKTQQLRIND